MGAHRWYDSLISSYYKCSFSIYKKKYFCALKYEYFVKATMEKYDFQFKSWPVDFDVREVEKIRKNVPVVSSHSTSMFSITDMLAKLLVNSFGKFMVLRRHVTF